MRSVVRALWTLVALAVRADPVQAIMVMVLAPLAGASGVLLGLGIKWLVDAAASGSAAGLLEASALLAGTVTAMHMLGISTAIRRLALQQRIGLLIDRRIVHLCTGLPTLEHYENPVYLDRLDLLRSHRTEIARGIAVPIEVLRTVARFGGTLGLLAALDPRLLLLPALAIPAAVAGSVGQRVLRNADERSTEADRERRWLFTQGTSPGPATELRVYRLENEFAGRHEELQQRVHRIRGRAEVTATLLSTGGWLVFGLGYIAAIGLVLARAAEGQATAGDVALAITVASQVDGVVSGAVQLLGSFQGTLRSVGYYLWLVDHARDAEQAPPTEIDGRPSGDIVMRKVSFTYPGTARPILRDVSLRLPAGATVAIVGENGAGKTTLVKLLCRLHEPTQGRILAGGTDLRAVPAAQWRRHLAAGFQDFCRFELTARESVGVGDLPKIDDVTAVAAALDRAGSRELLEQLPDGLETQLGRTFERGTDLSLGQWQKIAMGRAMMRAEPAMLILDEPTASLDAETEHALFARWADLNRASKTTITVLVSHRFSTVRQADLIVVLDKGRVRETGGHDELMAADGLYADLYRLHANAYRDHPCGGSAPTGLAGEIL